MKRFVFFFLSIITLLCICVNAEEFFKDGKYLSSQYVYMVNIDADIPVYELDAEKITYPASLTKIMTCILAIEKAESLDEIVTVPSGLFDDIYADGGVNMALKTGEEISVGDLLRATMIRSACDSASLLAYYVSGSIDNFADLMNEKAAELGAKSTHFVNAHGLHDDNHYTTAKDMYLIAKYALQNSIFCDIISQHSCTIPATNKSEERYFTTTMALEDPSSVHYYPYVTGVKSGFTDQAGRCLITKAEKNGANYILVTLGANLDKYYEDNRAFNDAVTLYEYYFAQYSYESVISANVTLGEAEVENGVADTVSYAADREFKTLVSVSDAPKLNFDIYAIKAPVEKGEKIGTGSVETMVGTYNFDLIAISSVKSAGGKHSLKNLNDGNKIATSMDIASISFVLFTIVIIVLFVKKNKKHK